MYTTRQNLLWRRKKRRFRQLSYRHYKLKKYTLAVKNKRRIFKKGRLLKKPDKRMGKKFLNQYKRNYRRNYKD